MNSDVVDQEIRQSRDALMTVSQVALLLGYDDRYVMEQFAPTPGFPKALRLTGPGGRRGHPRWKRGDIIDWIDSHVGGKSKRGGRPRNP
jgi:predicted DNA-binding transcriptional regulator AlpA